MLNEVKHLYSSRRDPSPRSVRPGTGPRSVWPRTGFHSGWHL